MFTRLTAPHTALPPPMRHLLHRERPIGWLQGHSLGFVGFADAREAAHAAWVVHRTVSRKLAPLLGTRPTPIDIEPLAIETRNGRDVIVASGRPIATLVRPGHGSPGGANWFGFAIEVSPTVGEHSLGEAMRVASRALLKSGIAWSMVRSRSRRLGDACSAVAHSGPPVADRRRIQRRTRALDPFAQHAPRWTMPDRRHGRLGADRRGRVSPSP